MYQVTGSKRVLRVKATVNNVVIKTHVPDNTASRYRKYSLLGNARVIWYKHNASEKQ